MRPLAVGRWTCSTLRFEVNCSCSKIDLIYDCEVGTCIKMWTWTKVNETLIRMVELWLAKCKSSSEIFCSTLFGVISSKFLGVSCRIMVYLVWSFYCCTRSLIVVWNYMVPGGWEKNYVQLRGTCIAYKFWNWRSRTSSSTEVTNDFIHLPIYRDCLNICHIKRNSFVIILFECKITNAMKNSHEHVNGNEI